MFIRTLLVVGDASVRHNNVEPAETLNSVIQSLPELALAANVGFTRKHPPAGLLDH
jgi:hypothetical protein